MNQRIMLTKKLLKNSIIELLHTHDIYHISIRELCENAGINRSTFYKYYGSQFDLLKEMEDDLLKSIEEFLYNEVKNDQTNALSNILHYIEEEIVFVRLLINANVDPDFPNKLFSLMSIQSMLKEHFGNSVPENEYDYYTTSLIHGSFKIVCMWINKEERESSDWLADFLIRHIKKASENPN